MVSEAKALPADDKPKHSERFRLRRFANWFPLGLTYATLYMGRYNFNVSKGTIAAAYHVSKTEIGIVATCGFWVYAISVLVNGPLADRFGGRRAILLGTAGGAVMNLVIGLFFFHGGWSKAGLLFSLSVLYALNMYFQSFGALSVVKVNAAWFHYRERGILGGVFGSMISLGYWFAYGICGFILAHAPLWAVYVIPSSVMATMFAVDFFLVRNRPSLAGHEDFDTGDGEAEEVEAVTPPASGDGGEPGGAYRGGKLPVPEAEPKFFDVVKKVLSNKVLRTLAAAEFCTGLVRQGLLLYFPEFLKEVHHLGPGQQFIDFGLFTIDRFQIAAGGITVGGIVGALLCGILSDAFFQSRRAPVAFIFYLGQIVSIIILGLVTTATSAAFMIGVCAMWIFGVHGMLSGTASMDFGGKKAAATAAGLLDGVQYLGAGLTGVGLGYLLDRYHWAIWTYSLVPFSLIGAILMRTLWDAKPGKTAH